MHRSEGYGTFVEGRYDFPIYLHIKRQNTEIPIMSLTIREMTSYFHLNTISRREQCPEILVTIQRDYVILRHVT